MSVSKRCVLEALVAVYDREDRPVAVDEIVAESDASSERVLACLESFEACALVVVGEDTVRPTVTARELLALDTDDVVIVDPDPE